MPIFGVEADDERRALLKDTERALREIRREVKAQDPVAGQCAYVSFVSFSKGKDRRRRRPIEVELLGYGQRFHTIKPGGKIHSPIDTIADEVLEGTVAPEDRYDEFLKRLCCSEGRRKPRRRS